MRASSIAAGFALLVTAWIIADFLTHPEGTKALGTSVTGFVKTAGNQAIGVAG